jgi:aminopeptidase B
VTNSSWSEFFLNEGFTMYAERRLTEEAFGREHMALAAKLGDIALREDIANLGDENPLTRLHIPLEQGIDPGDCFTDCPYEKGYDFVCYLRSLVDSQHVSFL